MRARFLFSVTLVDLTLLVGAVLVSSRLTLGSWLPWSSVPGSDLFPLVAILGVSALIASVATAGFIGPGVPRPTFGRGLAIVGETVIITALGVIMFRTYFSRSFLLVTFILWAVLVTLHRVWRRHRPWTEQIVAISTEKELVTQLDNTSHAEVTDIIDPGTEGEITRPPVGTTIAIDLRAILTERVAQFVSSCDLAGYSVRPLASIYEEHTGRIPLVHLAEGWEIQAPLDQTSRYLFGKRLFDIVTVSLTAPIWLILAAMVAVVVRVSSPGKVIFSQTRVGREGKQFVLYKFRTMSLDAEANGPSFARQSDPRLIRGGAWLRRSRLDEIPQLWNVLKGEMSLVGPRAEQAPFVEEFNQAIPFYQLRHLVRPGITGWAQVNYRYADDLADTVEKLTHDLFYVRHMSPILDLEILWKSVWTVLTGAGAR